MVIQVVDKRWSMKGLFSTKKLNSVEIIFPTEKEPWKVSVGAGVSWKELIRQTLAFGQTPSVYTDWLQLSVGGTLSMGGIGQCSFRNGLQSDHVLECEVVTGNGEILSCSEKENPILFNAVRAGLGQMGILTKVVLDLIPAPSKVKVTKLIFYHYDSFLKSLINLATASSKVDALQAHIEPNVKDNLLKMIHPEKKEDVEKVGQEFLKKNQIGFMSLEQTQYDKTKEKDEIPDRSTDIEADEIFIEEMSFESYINRIPPILNSEYQTKKIHHEETAFISPAKAMPLILKKLEEMNTHENMGYGTVLIVPLIQSKIKTLFFRQPQSRLNFLVAILRRALPDSPIRPSNIRQMNYELLKFAKKEGAFHYPCDSNISFLSPMTGNLILVKPGMILKKQK